MRSELCRRAVLSKTAKLPAGCVGHACIGQPSNHTLQSKGVHWHIFLCILSGIPNDLLTASSALPQVLRECKNLAKVSLAACQLTDLGSELEALVGLR